MANIINHHGNVEEVSAPAFTPGPWRIRVVNRASGEPIGCNILYPEEAGKPDVAIASVYTPGRADARLIAAAPDGFDAGEEAIVALNAMMDAWFDYHDSHSLTQPVTGAAGNAFDKALAAREKLEAFIAKSLGEQQ